MNNPDVTGRLVLWAIELGEFDILYRSRTLIKAQALADIVPEFTAKEDEDRRLVTWMIQVDDLSNQRARGVKVVLQSPEGDLIECAVHLLFPKTNTKAEYEAVLLGLDLAKATRALSVGIHNDSQVIVEHINKDYKVKGEQMKEYLSMVKERVSQKFLAKFVQVPREGNEQTDHLAKVASAEHMVITGEVLFFIQYSLAINEIDV